MQNYPACKELIWFVYWMLLVKSTRNYFQSWSLYIFISVRQMVEHLGFSVAKDDDLTRYVDSYKQVFSESYTL